MDTVNQQSLKIKQAFEGAAQDIWEQLRKSAARHIAEQLIKDLDGAPSNCGKLVAEQVNELPAERKVA